VVRAQRLEKEGFAAQELDGVEVAVERRVVI